MNHLSQIDAIRSEKRIELIGSIAQKLKGEVIKTSFTSAMHQLAEKDNSSAFIAQSIESLKDFQTYEKPEENILSEMFG
jgi:hypothetical protein